MIKLVVEHSITRVEGGYVPVDVINKPLTYMEKKYLKADTRKKFASQAKAAGKKFNPNSHSMQAQTLFNDFDNTFPTGMLPKVIQALNRARFQFEVIDLRQYGDETLIFGQKTGKYANINPYPYQADAIDNILHKKRGLIRIACGGGKTLVAGQAIRELKRQSVFLVNRKGLLYQTKEVFEDLLGQEIGQVGDGIVDIKEVNVVMIQSLIRFLGGTYERFDEEDIDEDTTDVVANSGAIGNMLAETQVLVVDECHCIGAQTAYDCVTAFRNAGWVIGASATPVREDGKTIYFEACFGEKLADISFTYLIENGFLVQPYIYMIPLSERMIAESKKNARYDTIYRHGIVNNEMRNHLAIMEARMMHMTGHHPLILVQHVKHGNAIQQMMPEASFLHGLHKQKERKRVLNEFSEGKIKTLIASTIFDEAIDIPACDGAILLGGGCSYVRTIQRMSRPMRLDRSNPKKDKCFIVDFWDVDNIVDRHSKLRYSTYKSEAAFKIIELGGRLPY
jgi:superfamily II DNA or RNA helicase